MHQALHSSRRADSESSARIAATGIVVRPVSGAAEFLACVTLQQNVWGPGYADRVPASLLQVATHVGGVVIGAFRGEELIGMVFGLTGFEGEERVHWSHMLGVRDVARDVGVGRLLKDAQRAWLAERGVTRMSWTFDPLVAKNAFFNLNRLGARVIRYVDDMYGASTSPLHQGAPTDRLVVTVDPRVPPAVFGVERALRRRPLLTPAPHTGDVLVDTAAPPDALWIEVPGDVHALKDEADGAVAEWRHAVRAHFTWALAHGYTVRVLERDVDASRAFYLLTRSESA